LVTARFSSALGIFLGLEVRDFDLVFGFLLLVSHFGFPLFGSLALGL
jgi:hypothetical protein